MPSSEAPPPMRADGRDNDATAVKAWTAQRRWLGTSFGDIAYVDRGGGEAAALFLHGFPLNSFQWRGAVERLCGLRRCIAPDALGLGFTEVRLGQTVAFGDQAAMLGEFLDRLGVAEVDLVANDSNTGVAQLFAARSPGRVRTMLLTNGDTEVDSPPAALAPVIELAKRGRFAAEVVAPQAADKDAARSPRGIGGLAFTRPERLSDAAIDHYLGPLVASAERRALADAYAAALAPNRLAGIGAALRRVQAPTRVVWGMADTFFSPEGAAHLDRALPNSRGVRAVPDGKLFFPEEYPDLIAEEARGLWLG